MENNFYNCNKKYYFDYILEEDRVGLNDNTKLYKEKIEDIMYKLFLEREKADADKILDFYAYPENHRIDGSKLEDFIMWNDCGNSNPYFTEPAINAGSLFYEKKPYHYDIINLS